jgi:hypothetical protein
MDVFFHQPTEVDKNARKLFYKTEIAHLLQFL